MSLIDCQGGDDLGDGDRRGGEEEEESVHPSVRVSPSVRVRPCVRPYCRSREARNTQGSGTTKSRRNVTHAKFNDPA